MRLKLEINCKEHFNVLDWVEFPFEVINDWYTGEVNIRRLPLNGCGQNLLKEYEYESAAIKMVNSFI